MSRFRKRFWVCLATSTLLGVFTVLGAPVQDSPARSKQQSRDDAPAGANKGTTEGDATGKDAADGDTPLKNATDKDTTGKNATEKADQKSATKAKREDEFVHKTDAEWRKILTRLQYSVTRQKGTEPAFSGKYATGHFRGTFLCICCDAEVFKAQNKFDSGTGWPSFDRPASARALVREMDYSSFEPRVEVNCRRCGAHLGHVFDDGPTITGLRFCINSVAIKLKPPEVDSGSGPTSARMASRAKSKARAKSKTKSAANAKAVGHASDAAESAGSGDGDQARSRPAAIAAR